jgi:hypothetical protein
MQKSQAAIHFDSFGELRHLAKLQAAMHAPNSFGWAKRFILATTLRSHHGFYGEMKFSLHLANVPLTHLALICLFKVGAWVY